MAEPKVISKLEAVHLAQAMNYPETAELLIGILLNFGAKSLAFKRRPTNKIIK